MHRLHRHTALAGLLRRAEEPGVLGEVHGEQAAGLCQQLPRFHLVRAVAQAGGGEALGDGGLRVGKHVVDAAVLHHFSVLHHGDLVGDGADDVHLVRDHHDGDAQFLVDPAQHAEHLLGGLGVQGGGGLVGKQERRVACQRSGDAHALLLAAGELLRVVLAALAQADEVEQLGDAALALLLVHAGQLERVLDVARGGAGGKEVELLEDHADVATDLA